MAGQTRVGPLARLQGYLGNIGKEAGDFGRAYKKASNLSSAVGPGTDTAASKARKQQDKELVQLAMAVIQGRRYDDKGRRR